MNVNGLDHVNIRTRDVTGTARFYADLLDLEPRAAMASMSIEQACWLFDREGHAIIHLFDGDSPSGPTGAIHHIALRCSGKTEMIERLQQRNIPFDMREVRDTLTQIFVRDPHGILLELNFNGE